MPYRPRTTPGVPQSGPCHTRTSSPPYNSCDASPVANREKKCVAVASVTASEKVRRAPTSDRKSTRLNSSHLVISYAVFCLKKKKQGRHRHGAARPRGQLLAVALLRVGGLPRVGPCAVSGVVRLRACVIRAPLRHAAGQLST